MDPQLSLIGQEIHGQDLQSWDLSYFRGAEAEGHITVRKIYADHPFCDKNTPMNWHLKITSYSTKRAFVLFLNTEDYISQIPLSCS